MEKKIRYAANFWPNTVNSSFSPAFETTNELMDYIKTFVIKNKRFNVVQFISTGSELQIHVFATNLVNQ